MTIALGVLKLNIKEHFVKMGPACKKSVVWDYFLKINEKLYIKINQFLRDNFVEKNSFASMKFTTTTKTGQLVYGQNPAPKVTNKIDNPTSTKHKIYNIYKETKSIIEEDRTLQMKKIVKAKDKILAKCVKKKDSQKILKYDKSDKWLYQQKNYMFRS